MSYEIHSSQFERVDGIIRGTDSVDDTYEDADVSRIK